MKKWYYYFRDEENRPHITVCLIEHEGDYARGIAICSLKDNFSKKSYYYDEKNNIVGGRDIAEKRAMEALTNKESNNPINRGECFDVFEQCMFDLNTEFKSEFIPELSPFEQRLIKKKETESKIDEIDKFLEYWKELEKKLESNENFEFNKEFNNGIINYIVGGYRGDFRTNYHIEFSHPSSMKYEKD